MMDSAIAKRYAQALFALAQERQEIKKIESELLALKETLENNNDLRSVIYHQVISSQDKKQLISEIFKNLSQSTANFLFLLIDKRREKYLEMIIDLFHKMCMDLDKVINVEVTSAAPLAEENKSALITKLSTLTGKKVTLEEKVDENLLGGLIVKIGDKILDGSVISRLEALRSTLKKVTL